jgi:methionine-rich copper-binding protein CopC/putative copper export protein
VNGLHRTGRVVAVAMLIAWHAPAGAHSGLRFSSPLDGSTLGDTPQQIHLTFVERPEPALSTVRVVDTSGAAHATGRPEPADGDPLSLIVPLQPLGRGVYTVHWRVVSAVDGHASSGVFAFGVLVSPTAITQPAAEQNESSAAEALARSLFLIGVLVALGAAAAFAVSRSFPVPAAAAGTGAAAVGLVLLAIAQMRVAGVGAAQLAATTVGAALIDRAVAVAVMAAAVALSWHGVRRSHGVLRAAGITMVAAASIAAIVAHAAAGHAAAGRWPVPSTVALQAVHIAAAGVWLGGLAALLLAMRHAAPADSARVFARFSILAGLGLAAIMVTGAARGVHEIPRWRDLAATPYGAIVAAKVFLLVAIAALGARNYFRNVALAATNPAPLRRAASAELALAIVATAAAGWLGTLSPPAAASSAAAIEVTGSDFATTIRATLQVMSDQPGPNRFVARVDDYDSNQPITAAAVRLRFTPLDDAGVTPTVLDLRASEEGFTGSGANLAFPGRWRVNMLVERNNSSVDVPLTLEARGQPQSISVLRPPRMPPSYTAEVGDTGFVRIVVDSEREGPSALLVTTHNVIYEPMPVDHIVVTIGDGAGARQLPVTRQNRNRFSTATEFSAGKNRITVIARSDSGSRLHATFVIDVSSP